jgi:hypothetical protein
MPGGSEFRIGELRLGSPAAGAGSGAPAQVSPEGPPAWPPDDLPNIAINREVLLDAAGGGGAPVGLRRRGFSAATIRAWRRCRSRRESCGCFSSCFPTRGAQHLPDVAAGPAFSRSSTATTLRSAPRARSIPRTRRRRPFARPGKQVPLFGCCATPSPGASSRVDARAAPQHSPGSDRDIIEPRQCRVGAPYRGRPGKSMPCCGPA